MVVPPPPPTMTRFVRTPLTPIKPQAPPEVLKDKQVRAKFHYSCLSAQISLKLFHTLTMEVDRDWLRFF